MNVQKISAFSDGQTGGNPAGVVICDQLPSVEDMQAQARDIGFSETAFAAPIEGSDQWRVRYFSPETEVPFCGHATIALGAALAEHHGDGRYGLTLNNASITVDGTRKEAQFAAALQSPGTHSRILTPAERDDGLALFGLKADDLDDRLPPAFIHAGANHYMFALKDRPTLAAMRYDLDTGRQFMLARDLVTMMLVHWEDDSLFHARNAFASGGVLEDPATGAAAAAFAGYLRDHHRPEGGQITIVQGEDMGARSLITAEFGAEKGGSVNVSGTTRAM